MVTSPVRRLPSMFPLIPENVSWVRPRMQMPTDQNLPEPMTYQLPQTSLAATQQCLPLVQVEQACLHGHSLRATLVSMMPPLRPCPPNLVSKRSTRVILHTLTYFPGTFPQNHLPGQQSSLTTSWIRIPNHPLHPRSHRLTTTALQIGHAVMLVALLSRPARRRVRTEARPAQARSGDAARGALSHRAYTMTRRKATARASGTT